MTDNMVALISNPTHVKNHELCSKIFLGITSVIALVIGLGLTGVGSYLIGEFYIGATTVFPWMTTGIMVSVLVTGLILFISSLAVLISTCHHGNPCAKVIMVFLSMVSGILTAATAIVTICAIVMIAGYHSEVIDTEINASITEAWQVCCVDTNSTDPVKDTCSVVMDETHTADDCSDYSTFYQAVMHFLQRCETWIAASTGVTLVLCLTIFICSCKLICYKNREAYYRPNPTRVVTGGSVKSRTFDDI